MAICYLSDDTAAVRANAASNRMIDLDAFRTVFDASSQGVIVHRCHKPLYVNHAWSDFHGYEPDEVMARETVIDLLSPEDRERLVMYSNHRLAGRPAPSRYHYQAVHKSGRLTWAEIFVQQLDWFGEPAIQCTVIDARYRDDAMAEMLRRAHEINEKFLQALNESAEGFILYDKGHRLLVWNRRFIQIYPELDGVLKAGMTYEEIVRTRVDLALIRDAVGQEEAWIEDRLGKFGRQNRRLDMRNAGGRWYQVSEKTLADGCILQTSIDITERRAAEQALAAEQTLLRAIIDNIPDAIYAKDREAKFIVKNRFGADLMGAETPEETIGKTDFDYYPECLAEETYADDMSVILHGASIIKKEQQIRRSDDQAPVWLSATKVPLRDAKGTTIGLVGCSRDITARKAIELDLARYRDHLEEMVEERTAEIERQKRLVADALDKERELSALQRQFVSMVCHEFRTPLAVIDGNAQRLLRRQDKIQPDRLTTGLDKIRLSVKRLTELMESVLDAARLEAGAIEFDPKSCNPVEMITDVCANYREVNPTYRIVTDLEHLPECFSMDVKLMRQVVSNLVSNAIKYSPEGSHVWVGGVAADDGALRLSVRDQGVGIPKPELSRLFDRFFRASTSMGIAGTGIGLCMVKALVDMHDGSVNVLSEEGEGTTFIIDLPNRGDETVLAEKTMGALRESC